ncbi:oxidoreductase [Dactylosporangium sp. NPDC005572]|uniref:oxidoreductase n=1 Tax=Dactylosporangium sp. NPDC005572 TaxID=3156889 RepID=UPI0033BB0E5E
MSKVYLVTGSSRGLGRAIVEAALQAGHHVLATARDPDQLASIVAVHGSQVAAAALDVTDFAAAQQAVTTAINHFGRLDVVVNNAGYANLGALEDITIEDFREQVDTNLFGVVNVCKAVIPVLRTQRSGHIINVSSVGGRVANAGLSAYQAAKWALGGLTEVLAAELNPLGINVTVVEPGGMRTDWAGSSMAIRPVSEPYDQTVGVLARLFTAGGGTAAGDPDKVARLLVRLANEPNPPLRLLLGSDAVTAAEKASAARHTEDATWRHWSVMTDHDQATPEQLDPLAHAE